MRSRPCARVVRYQNESSWKNPYSRGNRPHRSSRHAGTEHAGATGVSTFSSFGDSSPAVSSHVLQARGIGKRFAGTNALEDVDLCLRAGEVHALMGQNGAGKSTLIKVLTGVLPPDAGSMELDGHDISPASPIHAQHLGI